MVDMAWPYFTEQNGKLFDEQGVHVPFDGKRRTDSEWESYFEENDIRGNIR